MTSEALFDMPSAPAPRPCVERLLSLAGQFVRYNDRLGMALRGGAPGQRTHAAAARHLAAATLAAIEAINDQHLSSRTELDDTVDRLRQLAYLSGASAGHDAQSARPLTALAPAAVVDSAVFVAAEIRRCHRATAPGGTDPLPAAQYAALQEIARGHVTVVDSLGRQYVHSRHTRVTSSTLRALEAKQLTDRIKRSAVPPHDDGPPLDRAFLAQDGTAALAAALILPPPPTPARGPAARPAPAPSRSR